MGKLKLQLILLCLVYLLCAIKIPAEKAVEFNDLVNVTSIKIDGNHIYIIDGTFVHIYARNGYNKISTFGRNGEGPGEFSSFVLISPLDNRLLINSLGKISYYTHNGEFISEKKSNTTASSFFNEIKDHYVGLGVRGETDGISMTVNLFDKELKKGKELLANPKQAFNKMALMNMTPCYCVFKNIIYASTCERFFIKVFNANGDSINAIEFPRHSIKFPHVMETNFRTFMKRRYAVQYEYLKDRIYFPEFLPILQKFYVKDDRIYGLIYTEESVNGVYELYTLDLFGLPLRPDAAHSSKSNQRLVPEIRAVTDQSDPNKRLSPQESPNECFRRGEKNDGNSPQYRHQSI